MEPDTPLYEMIKIFFNSNFFIHPVIDKNGRIIGAVKYDKIKNLMLTSPDDSRTAGDIMLPSGSVPRIKITDTLDVAVHSFFNKNTDELVVVDAKGAYRGILRKRDVLLAIEGGEGITPHAEHDLVHAAPES